MGYNPPMDNELLTLWIKAGAGLSRDDARELVQRLADERAEHGACCREVEEVLDTLENVMRSSGEQLHDAFGDAEEALAKAGRGRKNDGF